MLSSTEFTAKLTVDVLEKNSAFFFFSREPISLSAIKQRSIVYSKVRSERIYEIIIPIQAT